MGPWLLMVPRLSEPLPMPTLGAVSLKPNLTNGASVIASSADTFLYHANGEARIYAAKDFFARPAAIQACLLRVPPHLDE